jgi:polysaccharide biosynthesis/export protein
MNSLPGARAKPWRSGRTQPGNRYGLRAVGSGTLLSMVLVVWPAWGGVYKVQQGDTIEIAVAGIPELRQRSTVQPDGAIALPLVGALRVEGLTPAELRLEVQTQLARKIYRLRGNDGREILTVIQPEEVSAAIVAYRPIYVTGNVPKPGEQTFRPEMTVRQALALAGGADFQALVSKPSRNPITLRSDYELAVIQLAQATAKISRVTAELNGANELEDLHLAEMPAPKERLAEVENTERAILEASMSDYRRERDFLKAATDQADQRISVVEKLRTEEEEGSRADTVELRRLLDLLSKGQETNPRITDARRALLLSSTRALQVNVELLELKRQRSDSVRKAQHFEDERRIALLKELQDAVTEKTALQIKIQGLELDLRSPSGLSFLGGVEENIQRTIEVVRQGNGAPSKSIVDDDFVLMPGDVIDVSFRSPKDAANASR